MSSRALRKDLTSFTPNYRTMRTIEELTTQVTLVLPTTISTSVFNMETSLSSANSAKETATRAERMAQSSTVLAWLLSR